MLRFVPSDGDLVAGPYRLKFHPESEQWTAWASEIIAQGSLLECVFACEEHAKGDLPELTE